MISSVYHYLQQGRVVNIFYAQDKITLESYLLDYINYGTRSLARKYYKSNTPLCEYKCYKVLTFFDSIPELIKHVIKNKKDFPLIYYLVDYIFEACTIECVRCNEIDFATHYIKRSQLEKYNVRKVALEDNFYFVKSPLDLHLSLINVKSGIDPITTLDPRCVYRVLYVKYSKVTTQEGDPLYYYTILLFKFVKPYLLGIYWIDQHSLSNLYGSKRLCDRYKVDIDKRQYVYLDKHSNTLVGVLQTSLKNLKRPLIK